MGEDRGVEMGRIGRGGVEVCCPTVCKKEGLEATFPGALVEGFTGRRFGRGYEIGLIAFAAEETGLDKELREVEGDFEVGLGDAVVLEGDDDEECEFF
jgi:hypothetical protein